jgi:hypothetical protein
VGKEKLFMLVKENQPKEKSFRIDQWLSALGHTVSDYCLTCVI